MSFDSDRIYEHIQKGYGPPYGVNPNGTPPRIYVASLSDYNAGRLHGVWINLEALNENDSEVVFEVIREMLKAGTVGAEEWAIHDYEGFGLYKVSENENITELLQVVNGMGQYGVQFTYWNDIGVTAGPEGPLLSFEDGYKGCWDTFQDFADEHMEAFYGEVLGEMEKVDFRWIDREQYAFDLILGGDHVAYRDANGVHVFWTHAA